MAAPPKLYFDLGSPYAYLAVERSASVLRGSPELVPVLLGAIFRWSGHGSWADGQQRDANLAVIAARAERYGLPPVVWPPGWPADSLRAMRTAVWANEQGRLWQFARAAFRAQFAEGRSLAAADTLAACARAAGLPDPGGAAEDPAIKDELRRLTAAAWEAGVRGVPALAVEGRLFFGDDQLDLAAATLGI